MAPLRASISLWRSTIIHTDIHRKHRISTLREAARCHNSTTAFMISNSNYAAKRITGRCRENGTMCSTYCHRSRNCPSSSKLCLQNCDIDSVTDCSLWLTDAHITAASESLLRLMVCKTVLQHNSTVVPTSEFIQFLHVDNCHWVTLSSIGEHGGTGDIFESRPVTCT